MLDHELCHKPVTAGKENEMLHPNRIPGSESATVPDSKLEYLLELDEGKAGAFAKLGYTSANADQLRDVILTQLPTLPVAESRPNDGGGTSYAVKMTIEGPTGNADFRVVCSKTSGATSLTTAYRWRDKADTTTL
jgi:hypothetical protein